MAEVPRLQANDPTPQSCAVCGFILSKRTKADGSEDWIHANAPDDHPVVRVDWTEIRTNVRCDFCLADNAQWTLPVEDYVVDSGNHNTGSWAACNDCADLLRADDWKGLTNRSWKSFVALHGPTPRYSFEMLYDQLRPHILGPVYLY